MATQKNVKLDQLSNGQERSINKKEMTIMRSTFSVLTLICDNFNRGLAALAGICITLTMLLIVGNSILRLFADPFSGTSELVGWLGAIAISFSLGYTQMEKGHVDIDMLVKKFPLSIQLVIQSLVYVISICFFFILGWQMVIYGHSLMESGVLAGTIKIIFYPFVYLVALGFLGLTLALLMDFIKMIKGGEVS